MLKRVALFCLVVLMCLSTIAVSAEGKLKVTNKNLIVYSGEDNGYFFAKVENVGDTAVGVESGDLVIFSEDDEIILSENYITTLPSYVVLQPGDYLYAKEYLWDSALQNATIGDYKFSVPIQKSKKVIKKVPCEATIELKGVDTYNNYLYVTFTNSESTPIYNYYVSAALFDAEGTIIYADGYSLSGMALHPGGTVTVRLYVDQEMMEYYQMNQIVPTTIDAMVCYEVE